jgi:hypothetical protein
MSYIDTFDHELVAFFAGLPLYHPLEQVSGSLDRPDEFACSPGELILGGGEGEHPAMILREPGMAVRHFLGAALMSRTSQLPAREQAMLDDTPLAGRCLAFPGWSLEEIVEFAARCMAPGFVKPFLRERDGPMERWVACNLGEFVYFAMPELAAGTLADLPAAQASVAAPMFLNVLILPPGYGAPAGRYRAESGTVIWGNYAWASTRRPTWNDRKR